MADPRDPSGFYTFAAILEEGRGKGHSFETARKVYERRTGNPCPFHEKQPVLSTITIDFETCSELDLAEVGAWVYAEHPSTRILCLSYCAKPDTPFLWTPPEPLAALQGLFDRIAWGHPVEAHNADFEEAIWSRIGTPHLGFPRIPRTQWRDTMARAGTFAHPRALATLAKALGTAPKDAEGGKLMLQLCKPAKPTKTEADPWRRHTPENLARLGAYCRQDVVAEMAAADALPELSKTELAVFHATMDSNARGQCVDLPGAMACARMLELSAADWDARLRTVTSGLFTAGHINSHADIKSYAALRGVPLASTDKLAVAEALAGELPADVRVVLECRQALGKASTAKVYAYLNRTSSDGRTRGGLVYHGADTGRWSERGIQRQNLPKYQVDNVDACLADMATLDLETFTLLWGDAFRAVQGCLRGLLTAAPGHDLIAGDYNAIEARKILWLAGDPGLSLFAKGADIYKEMAAIIYRRRAETIANPSPERDLGKKAVLGCGFGQGWKKFAETCRDEGMPVTDELAQLAVNGYRERFPQVPLLWKGLESAAISAIRQPDQAFTYRLIAYKRIGAHLYCRLPSSRKIVYPRCSLKECMTPWGEMREQVHFWGMDTITKQWSEQHTYGGSLAENVAQASARDVAADAILRCAPAGLPLVSMAHDEIVAEIPEANPITLKEFETFMCQLPAWADGLPVKAAAWRGKRYRK